MLSKSATPLTDPHRPTGIHTVNHDCAFWVGVNMSWGVLHGLDVQTWTSQLCSQHSWEETMGINPINTSLSFSCSSLIFVSPLEPVSLPMC